MKKIICLILALTMALTCVFALASCGDDPAPTPDNGDNTPEIYGIVAESAPTKIVTHVDYTDAQDEDLSGTYTMSIEGNNSIFEYVYKRYSTIEEGVAEDCGRIKTIEGTIYYKDGQYSYNGGEWGAEAPTASDLKFNIDPTVLTNATISEDGCTLTASLDKETALAVIGTDLSAEGTVELTVETNGTYLTRVVITCTTTSGGEMTITTSYSYSPIELEFIG